MLRMYASWLNAHIFLSNALRIWSNAQFAKCALHKYMFVQATFHEDKTLV